MKQDDKFISLSSILKELHAEDNPGRDEGEFISEYTKRFSEILSKLGVPPELLKAGGKYQIPSACKEYVKVILRQYTSRTMKAVRKGKLDESHLDELEHYVKKIEVLLSETLEGQDLEFARGTLYVISRYLILSAIKTLRISAIERIVSDVEEVKTALFNEESKFSDLNDSDRAHLLAFYGELLEEASRKWHAVVSIVSDMRTEEIIELAEMELESGEEYDFPLPLEDINILIWRAVQEYHGTAKKEERLLKPTPEQMRTAAEVIERVKATKKTKSK